MSYFHHIGGTNNNFTVQQLSFLSPQHFVERYNGGVWTLQHCKNINKYRITTIKFNKTPSLQHIF